jgi:transposase
MTGHTPIPKLSRLEVIETGARRRWTPEEKQRIVAESFGAPRIVSATARRHGLSNSQLFTWRRLAREGKLIADADAVAFVPAVVAPELRIPDAPPEPGPESLLRQADRKARAGGRMEIVLSGARRVIVGSDVDAAALMRVIDALERR